MVLLIFSLIIQSTSPMWWIDGTPLIPGIMEIDRRHDPSFEATGPLSTGKGHNIGDTVNFWCIDESTEYPQFYLTSATCRYVGDNTYIFVEDTQWDIHYNQIAVDEFSQALEDSTPSGPGGIVETDVDVFGQTPDAIDGDPRIYFLVLDIRDGFDPQEGGAYIAGFFSPYNQFTETEAYLYYGGHSNEVEMLYIDCFPSNQSDASYTASHELVHLIQWGVAPFSSEELWVMENQAQSGTFVCGYPAFQVETFLEVGGITPIKWTNIEEIIEYVAGYGAGYLYFAYLYENYGGSDFLYESLRSEDRGIAGISEAICTVTGSNPDMSQILLDWMLACWIDDTEFGNGKYGWESFHISDYDTVSTGNRPGLDYTFEIETDPFLNMGDHMSSYKGMYYSVNETLSGSFRAGAAGLGEMKAFLYDESGGSLEQVDTGSANEVAISLPESAGILLLCSSFSGLDLDVSAGSIITSPDVFTYYPQPCRGTLFFQFWSGGSNIELSVFTVSGEFVETVSYNNIAGGEATLAYPGASSLASGIYFFRFSQGSRIETGSFAVVR